MKRLKKTAHPGMMLIAVAFLVFGLAGSAMALHPDIQLRTAGNAVIPAAGLGDLQPAFSVKMTCGACHDGTTAHEVDWDVNGDTVIDASDTVTLFSYDQIEKHSFHAQMGANQLNGWAAWNPDSTSKYLRGAGPKSKNWVQSPGHFGKW